MQTTIDINADLFKQAEQCAREKNQPLSAFIEQALRDSLHLQGAAQYGEPLTDDDIGDTARVTFRMLDEEENRAQAQ